MEDLYRILQLNLDKYSKRTLIHINLHLVNIQNSRNNITLEDVVPDALSLLLRGTLYLFNFFQFLKQKSRMFLGY